MAPDHLAADDSEGVAIVCDDQQDDAPVDTQRWVTLARRALRHEGVSPPCEMGLLFVDAAQITVLNEEHLGGTGPTDVLAFPIDDVESFGDQGEPADGSGLASAAPQDHPPRLLGDVVVCPEVAARAVNTGGVLEDELALLVVHGILHLLGHDHAEPEEKAVMQARERELLAAYASSPEQ